MKITDYPINNDPNPETEYVVCAYSGQNYKILSGNLNFFSPRNKMIPLISDFMNLTDQTKFYEPGVSSATLKSSNNHPGIYYGSFELTRIMAGYTFLGGEVLECIFKKFNPGNDYIGIFSRQSPAAPTNGIYISIIWTGAGGNYVVTGIANTAGTSSSTATAYTITDNAWVRIKIVLNSTKTRVDFFLYDDSGNLIWTDSVTSNIPSTLNAAHDEQVAWIPTGNTTEIDWMALYNNTELVR